MNIILKLVIHLQLSSNEATSNNPKTAAHLTDLNEIKAHYNVIEPNSNVTGMISISFLIGISFIIAFPAIVVLKRDLPNVDTAVNRSTREKTRPNYKSMLTFLHALRRIPTLEL